MFQTSNLNLVAYDIAKHRDIISSSRNNYELVHYLTSVDIVPRTEAYSHALIDTFLAINVLFSVFELKETGEVVGWVNSSVDGPRNRNGLLGIVVRPEYWGKGYAQEVIEWTLHYAFLNLGYHRMGLSVFAGNERAVRLYTKLGFKEEGRIRESLYKDGKWEDTVQMGILKREWKAMQTAKLK